MLGSIVGDIAGSLYEFNPVRRTDFVLLGEGVNYTDDTILAVAVADWVLSNHCYSHDEKASTSMILTRHARESGIRSIS